MCVCVCVCVCMCVCVCVCVCVSIQEISDHNNFLLVLYLPNEQPHHLTKSLNTNSD